MGTKVAIEHRTVYRFDRPVAIHPHVVRLRPAPHSRTAIESYSFEVTPAHHFVNWQQDPFGNYLARLVFPEPATELSFTVSLVADLAVINPFDFFIEEYAEEFGFAYHPELAADLEPYLRKVDGTEPGSGAGPVLRAWLADFHVAPGTRMVDFLVQLNAAVHTAVGYSVRMEAGVQAPDHTLLSAIGSCRDSAWLLVAILRELGLAARFVSGYLVQLTADTESLDGPSGPAADFTDLHAWAEVYVPGAGWIGLDATSGLFAGEGHIPLAATPQPASAAPITGATGVASATMEFSNLVRRVHEDPRVTLPYTHHQWSAIDALGHAVDRRLVDGDVRLTVGGEPTFVSADDGEAAEWTIDADGPDKRSKAGLLADRLKAVYAPQGLVQRSQGKWYPGEPLPRWQIALIWRTDGEPVWRDPALLVDPWNDPEPTPVLRGLAAGVAARRKAERDAVTAAEQAAARAATSLAYAIARSFGLPDSQVRPAYEDAIAKLAQQVRLPKGDPPEPGSDLGAEDAPDAPDVRRALVERLDATVTEPTAHVVPLHVRSDGGGWASSDWRLRRGRVVLTPGSSPAGLRLPLDSLAWQPADDVPELDPTLVGEEPPELGGLHAAVVPAGHGEPTTALVVEARGRHVYAFLPPLEDLDRWLELVGAIEAAASRRGVRLVVEGYGPPGDPRLQTLSVTPDPGVIEVNVQPTSSWSDLTAVTDTLYELARQTRLRTETFGVDGAHGGTGGGNHVTLGGVTPAESPLLRRPDLLVSMLTFWQHHPSLSYLFSGRFIGPTSQAPRADEGRPETLYEMEIAFAEIDRLSAHEGGPRPWTVDRALRNLLTDLTGNTHRAEFCIDKMYSPDSARGRLGLLELRGFEMPPHPQMSLVQALLIRSLVARFWDEPYRHPLIRHGAALHGRYLLPHFVISDIGEVAADLRRHGIDFATSWLEPFTEFRFPRIGSVSVAGTHLELRGAIEPWNVLGEEATAGGTARYVDSSVERLQVQLDHADPARYLLTCNDIPVPLLPTGMPGRYVAGIRYRAWQPPSALHPSIEPHSPLVLDLVDLLSGISVGGCTYHVTHPGGRSFDTHAVNAFEAESRRTRRFEPSGSGSMIRDVAGLRELAARVAGDPGPPPGILDLRRIPVALR